MPYIGVNEQHRLCSSQYLSRINGLKLGTKSDCAISALFATHMPTMLEMPDNREWLTGMEQQILGFSEYAHHLVKQLKRARTRVSEYYHGLRTGTTSQ